MRHLSDDQLVLHYYGEDGRDLAVVESHLRRCDRCSIAYQALQRGLDLVMAPEFPDVASAMPPVRDFMRDRLREIAARDASPHARRRTAVLVAAVWLVALIYPLSLRLLFASGQWAAAHPGLVPLVIVVLLFACAGPVLAAFILQYMPRGGLGQRSATRLGVVGSLVAASAPASFLLARSIIPRGMASDDASWYAVLIVGALCAVRRWPRVNIPNRPVASTHRVFALLLMAFLLAHVVNQALAFVSPPSYAAMRSVMRLASVTPVTYAAILVGLVMVIGSGVIASLSHVGPGMWRRNLQATTGWFLAAFLLQHVFSGLLIGAPPSAAGPAITSASMNLLATTRGIAQLPFLLLGVAAFLFHVGVYARLVAVAFLAERSVRRWSYAGAVAGGVLMIAVGLSLCGIHL